MQRFSRRFSTVGHSNRTRVLLTAFIALAIVLGAHDRSQAQGTTTAAKDAQGLAVAEQALAAHGGAPEEWGYQDSVTTGTYRRAGMDSTGYSITFKSKGMNLFRSELRHPEGTSILVRKNGESVMRFSDGSTKELQLYNDLSRRADHIPTLSLLGDRMAPEVAISGPRQAIVNGKATDTIEFHIETDKYGMPDFVREVSRRVFHVDRLTGLVTKVEFDNRAENSSHSVKRVEIYYSDYKQVEGIWIPFRQTGYADGELLSDLVLDSVQFNVGLSDAEFELPR